MVSLQQQRVGDHYVRTPNPRQVAMSRISRPSLALQAQPGVRTAASPPPKMVSANVNRQVSKEQMQMAACRALPPPQVQAPTVVRHVPSLSTQQATPNRTVDTLLLSQQAYPQLQQVQAVPTVPTVREVATPMTPNLGEHARLLCSSPERRTHDWRLEPDMVEQLPEKPESVAPSDKVNLVKPKCTVTSRTGAARYNASLRTGAPSEDHKRPAASIRNRSSGARSPQSPASPVRTLSLEPEGRQRPQSQPAQERYRSPGPRLSAMDELKVAVLELKAKLEPTLDSIQVDTSQRYTPGTPIQPALQSALARGSVTPEPDRGRNEVSAVGARSQSGGPAARREVRLEEKPIGQNRQSQGVMNQMSGASSRSSSRPRQACGVCGTRSEADSKFCQNCGRRLESKLQSPKLPSESRFVSLEPTDSVPCAGMGFPFPDLMPSPKRPAISSGATPEKASTGEEKRVRMEAPIKEEVTIIKEEDEPNDRSPSSGSPTRHTQQQNKNAIILNLLANRNELKERVVRSFNKVAAGKSELDIEELQQFREFFAKSIRVPLELKAFEDLEAEYMRFDFSGTGCLDVKEVYKLAKFQLQRYAREMGMDSDTKDIPQKSLGRMGYKIVKELGRGNQGIAKLATRNGEKFCLKCYPKATMLENGVLELKEEFEALKLLHCENIAGAFDMFQDTRNYYTVGEVYTGGDLVTLKERAMAAHVDLTEDWWRDIFRQCFEGILFMHEQAIIHCDIKEPNIMIKTSDFEQPKVVIIDLGVSTAMITREDCNVSGTPGYVPPETLDTLKWFPVGDIFSMGVVILQLMTDKIPDRENGKGIFIEGCRTVDEIFLATRKRHPPFYLLPKEWPNLRELVERCLKKQMSERLKARLVFKQDWFAQARLARNRAETAEFGERRDSRPLVRLLDGLKPRSDFATIGITKEFLAGLTKDSDEEDDDETESNRAGSKESSTRPDPPLIYQSAAKHYGRVSSNNWSN